MSPSLYDLAFIISLRPIYDSSESTSEDKWLERTSSLRKLIQWIKDTEVSLLYRKVKNTFFVQYVVFLRVINNYGDNSKRPV